MAGDEDRWLCVIQCTHMLFCDCKDFRGHLACILGWRTDTSDQEGDSGVGTGGGGGLDGSDELMAAALDAVEGGGDEEGER